MRLKYILIIIFMFIGGCESTYIEPHVAYRVNNFDIKNIKEIEVFMKKTALKWNLEVAEKDRKQLKVLSSGVDAFLIFLLHKNTKKDWIVDIGNVGSGTTLTVMFYDRGILSKSELESFINEIMSYLGDDLKLNICEMELSTSLCK